MFVRVFVVLAASTLGLRLRGNDTPEALDAAVSVDDVTEAPPANPILRDILHEEPIRRVEPGVIPEGGYLLDTSFPMKRRGLVFFDPDAEDLARWVNDTTCVPGQGIKELPLPAVPVNTRMKAAAYQLDNCLKVLLLHNPVSPHTTSLTMAYPFGFCDDTSETVGVSHLVEHLVLLGSENYPSTTAWSENTLYQNGITICHTTSYVAELDSWGFEASMRVFGDLMAKPSLKSDMIKRELEAVESEYRKGLLTAGISSARALHSAANSTMPYMWSHIGSMETISGTSNKDEIDELDLWHKASDFHKNFYSANGAALVLTGGRSIYRMNLLVKEAMAAMPSFPKPVSEIDYTFPYDRTGIIVDNVFADRMLSLVFPIYFYDEPTADRFLTINPMEYLPFHVSYPGSLVNQLRDMNLAFSVTPQITRQSFKMVLVRLTIQLTPNGENNRDLILQHCFGYFNSLRQAGGVREEYINSHVKDTELRWLFIEDDTPNMDLSKQSAKQMLNFRNSQMWLSASTRPVKGVSGSSENVDTLVGRTRLPADAEGHPLSVSSYMPIDEMHADETKWYYGNVTAVNQVSRDIKVLTDELVKILTPDNAIIVTKCTSELDDNLDWVTVKDTLYGKEVRTGKLSDAQFTKYNEAIVASVESPGDNPWTPKEAFVPKGVQVIRAPFTVKSSEWSWSFRPRTMRSLSRVSIVLSINSPDFPRLTFENEVLNYVLSRAMLERFKSMAFERSASAGYAVRDVGIKHRSFQLQIQGFKERLTDFIDLVLSELKGFVPTDAEAEAGYRQAVMKYFEPVPPVQVAERHADVSVDDFKFEPDTMRTMNVQRTQAYAEDYMGLLFSKPNAGITWFRKLVGWIWPYKLRAVFQTQVVGNLSNNEATQIQNNMEEYFNFKLPSRGAFGSSPHHRVLPKGTTRLVSVSALTQHSKHLDIEKLTYAAVLKIQITGDSPRVLNYNMGMCYLMSQKLSMKFGEVLRTQKQLGYIVHAACQPGSVTYFTFSIQSEKLKPQQLLKEMREFLVQHEEEFAGLHKYSNRFSHIFPSGTEPTQTDIHQFWQTYILPTGKEHRSLTVEMYPHQQPPSSVLRQGAYTSPLEVRDALPLLDPR